MYRLTTNKDASEMGMLELAHNCCYVKDALARYRDFKTDEDARVLTRQLLKKYADGDDAFTCDEDFDEEMFELLQYGTDNIEGLIALFYRNLWAMAELRETLKAYEDAEEQGLLLKLPCKVGTPVFYVQKCICPYSCEKCGASRWLDNCYCDYKARIFEQKFDYRHLFAFGNTVFLTKEEAEQALKNM